LRAAAELEPDLIVMGEHTRDLVDRLLTRDVAQGVLHGARCPVWFVPPPRLAA
jgi:nucleotide-binding universal stress UspA family protein